eukprot:8813247-Pyramimonas_sp.AAC.1
MRALKRPARYQKGTGDLGARMTTPTTPRSRGQTPTGQATRRSRRARPACTSLRADVQCSGSAVAKTRGPAAAAKLSGTLELEASAKGLG